MFGDFFSAGRQEGKSTEKVAKTELPGWLTEAVQGNIGAAKDIATRPYQPYDYSRIAPFSPDQIASFDFLRSAAPQYVTPQGTSAMMHDAASAPAMSYAMPTLLDKIPGLDGSSYGLTDYMNPYIDSVLRNTLDTITEQGDQHQLNLNRQATMAGAFGDARHGVQSAELDKNLIELKGEAADRIYRDAFGTAAGLMGDDINRGFSAFGANQSSYEQMLQRMLSGGANIASTEGQQLRNLLGYTGALEGAGAKQQDLAQQSADLGYQDFLRQWNYPIDMLNLMSAVTTSQPYGKTTTTTTSEELPDASPFSKALGTALNVASFFI